MLEITSYNLPTPLATGRTAEIYPWQNDLVLKLFFDWFSLDNIEYEQRINTAVHTSGLPIPKVGDIVRVNEHYGLFYARVYGSAMWDVLQHKPWCMRRYAQRLAELHAEMHSCSIQADLPAQRRNLEYKIRHATQLPEQLRSKVLTSLEYLPDRDRLCHGDFHPANILITSKEEVIIDWIDSSIGNPLADVARTSIIALEREDSNQFGYKIERSLIRLFHSIYIRKYFELKPGGEDEYQRWLPIIAAARVEENITKFQPWLISQASM